MPTIRVPFAITARPSADAGAPANVPVVGPTTFDKVFSTEPLIGSSVVEMVSVLGADGPLAYVAMERIEGSLDGASGAFVLRHIGSIVDGVAVLTLDVVEGSGTRDLVGLTGNGSIQHASDGAFLTLTYSRPS